MFRLDDASHPPQPRMKPESASPIAGFFRTDHDPPFSPIL